MLRTLLISVSLVGLSLWWTYTLLWNSCTVLLIANTSYAISKSPIDRMTAELARNRALQYTSLGGINSEDIFFTTNEISHLIDVYKIHKPITIGLQIVAVLAWGVLLVMLIQKKIQSTSLFIATKILIALLSLTAVCLLLFDQFFPVFHQIFFPQGNWEFPAESLLIQIFPEMFWKLMVLLIIISISCCCGVFWLVGNQIKKHTTVV